MFKQMFNDLKNCASQIHTTVHYSNFWINYLTIIHHHHHYLPHKFSTKPKTSLLSNTKSINLFMKILNHLRDDVYSFQELYFVITEIWTVSLEHQQAQSLDIIQKVYDMKIIICHMITTFTSYNSAVITTYFTVKSVDLDKLNKQYNLFLFISHTLFRS